MATFARILARVALGLPLLTALPLLRWGGALARESLGDRTPVYSLGVVRDENVMNRHWPLLQPPGDEAGQRRPGKQHDQQAQGL